MFIILISNSTSMTSKIKGSNAERELIHLFWSTKDWTACRVAGSGSMKYPSPDIIASRGGLSLAIECKTTSKQYQYLEKKEIEELIDYSRKSGARPLVAVRFARKPWRFLDPNDLDKNKQSFSINVSLSELRGLTFEELAKSL